MPWSSNSLLNRNVISQFYTDYHQIPVLVDKATAAAAIAADQTKPAPARLAAAGEAIVGCVTISRERLGDLYTKPLTDGTNMMCAAENGALPEIGFQIVYNFATLPIIEAPMDGDAWVSAAEPPSVQFENWAPLVGALNLNRNWYRQNLHRACVGLLTAFRAVDTHGVQSAGGEIIAAAEAIASALVYKGD